MSLTNGALPMQLACQYRPETLAPPPLPLGGLAGGGRADRPVLDWATNHDASVQLIFQKSVPPDDAAWQQDWEAGMACRAGFAPPAPPCRTSPRPHLSQAIYAFH